MAVVERIQMTRFPSSSRRKSGGAEVNVGKPTKVVIAVPSRVPQAVPQPVLVPVRVKGGPIGWPVRPERD